MRTLYFFIIVLFFKVSNAQLFQVSNLISENKIATFSNQKLILIDFWATWCAPCIPATQQLEIVQSQFKDELFIVSVTDEQTNKVKTFLQKKDIRLMVINDDEQHLFTRYNVNRRPYAVLLNVKGDLLWEGHPSDLDYKKINYFIKKTDDLDSVGFNSVFNFNKLDVVFESNEIVDFEIHKSSDSETYFSKEYDQVFFNGRISELLMRLLNVSTQQIKIEEEQNILVTIKSSFKYWKTKKQKIIRNLGREFGISISDNNEIQKVKSIRVNSPDLLWNTTQIDWGSEQSNFLIGEDRLQADNTSINNLAALMSELKQKLYVYYGDDENVYDWSFHYLYDNLMLEELEDSFGITITDDEVKVPVYYIEKR